MLLPKYDRRLKITEVYSPDESSERSVTSDGGFESTIKISDLPTNNGELPGSSRDGKEARNFKIGDYVNIIKKPYKGYYAVIID